MFKRSLVLGIFGALTLLGSSVQASELHAVCTTVSSLRVFASNSIQPGVYKFRVSVYRRRMAETEYAAKVETWRDGVSTPALNRSYGFSNFKLIQNANGVRFYGNNPRGESITIFGGLNANGRTMVMWNSPILSGFYGGTWLNCTAH